MSHFYGTLKGSRGEATRGGTKSSGLHVQAASWEGCVEVYLTFDTAKGYDVAHVWLKQWRGVGPSPAILLYSGPVSGAFGGPIPTSRKPADAPQTPNLLEREALANVFGEEWSGLTDAARAAILADFIALVKDEYLDGGYSPTGDEEGDTLDEAREYRRRIGEGNLASYGDVMLVRVRA